MSNINIQTIPDGTTMMVKGIVDFSQIKTRLDGAELETDNQRKIQHGLKPESRPHTRLTISQASVVYDDASNISHAERFLEDRLYLSNKYPQKNFIYSGMNKGQYLPAVYVRDETDHTVIRPIYPENELAAGLEVTLLLRVYSSRATGYKGISLDSVICDEPIRYQNSANDSMTALFARGFKAAAPAAAPPPAYSAIPA